MDQFRMNTSIHANALVVMLNIWAIPADFLRVCVLISGASVVSWKLSQINLQHRRGWLHLNLLVSNESLLSSPGRQFQMMVMHCSWTCMQSPYIASQPNSILTFRSKSVGRKLKPMTSELLLQVLICIFRNLSSEDILARGMHKTKWGKSRDWLSPDIDEIHWKKVIQLWRCNFGWRHENKNRVAQASKNAQNQNLTWTTKPVADALRKFSHFHQEIATFLAQWTSSIFSLPIGGAVMVSTSILDITLFGSMADLMIKMPQMQVAV